MYVIICRNPRTNGVFLVNDGDDDDPKTIVFESVGDAMVRLTTRQHVNSVFTRSSKRHDPR